MRRNCIHQTELKRGWDNDTFVLCEYLSTSDAQAGGCWGPEEDLTGFTIRTELVHQGQIYSINRKVETNVLFCLVSLLYSTQQTSPMGVGLRFGGGHVKNVAPVVRISFKHGVGSGWQALLPDPELQQEENVSCKTYRYLPPDVYVGLERSTKPVQYDCPNSTSTTQGEGHARSTGAVTGMNA